MSEPLDFGLFPLDLVLLPGERVPLHIFEPRYQQLYADCTLEERPFVIVRAGPTGTAEVGCSARFETLVRRFEDGRLNVVIQGVAPVKVIEETDGHLYFSARVEMLDDEAPDAAPEAVAEILDSFRTLAGLGKDAMPEAPEGTPLSYAIGGAFELPLGPKQELLECRSEGDRLAMLKQFLAAVDKDMEHARMAAHRAGTNGRVLTP